MRLAGNENESEIGNGATRRCNWHGATRGLWVCGLIMGSLFVGSLFVGSWVRCSWVVGSLFVGSTISGWRSRRWCDDLHFLGSRSLALSLSLCLRVWVLSLSLSLFARLWKWFEGKILAENIFRVKGLNFTVNWNSFPENPFSIRNQTPANTCIYGKAFSEAIWTQNKHSLTGKEEKLWRRWQSTKVR